MTDISNKDSEQDVKIAVIDSTLENATRRMELIHKRIDRTDEKFHKLNEDVRERIRALEKWVWGAGAVLTAFIVIGGVVGELNLIPDGDVSAVIATSFEDSGVDIYMGIGGSPEGVLAAAALRCIGGKIYTKLIFDNDYDKERASSMGIADPNRIYCTNDLASGDVMFSATGVTDGTLLKGVLIKNEVATTQSVIMRSKTKTVRYVSASHNLRVKNIVK